MSFTTRQLLLIICIGLLSIVPRLYKITAAVADWHSFRQADTASVAREYSKNGIDILHPRYHDLSNIQSGKDNPMGYRMVEFPLYQVTAVILQKLLPFISLDIVLRLVSIVASSITILCFMIVIAHLFGFSVAIIAGLFYAFLPYNIFYNRTILPEMFMLMFVSASYLFTYLSSKRGHRFLPLVLGSGICVALAILVKPYAVFFLLPILGFILTGYTWTKQSLIYAALFSVIALYPFYWWRSWINQFPEGIASYSWLFNEGNIRFKGAWFYWLFAKRIGELICGYWGVSLLSIGLLAKKGKKTYHFLELSILGVLIYFIVIARGNVQHDYYQIPVIPIVSLLMGLGVYTLWKKSDVFGRVSTVIFVICVSLASFAFSWYTMRTYYWINNPVILEAGIAADTMLPIGAKVIAPYNGDTTFLYQTHRVGWPLGFDIDKKIQMGATHYVTISPTAKDTETEWLAQTYTVLVRNDRYAIIDLTRKNAAP